MSVIACTTCAAVITLPSWEMSTPDPVSLKCVVPLLVISWPLARITTTDGLTSLKTLRKSWATARGGHETSVTAARATQSSRRMVVPPWFNGNHGGWTTTVRMTPRYCRATRCTSARVTFLTLAAYTSKNS